MQFEAHDYQKFAIDFVEKHEEAILLLDMGLGKTVITLSAIRDLKYDSFEVEKVLVVAPLRVANTVWKQETFKWDHTSFLKVSVMTGSLQDRVKALSVSADIYVINRENVKWLVDFLEKHHKPWPFDMVVVDELSSFKNIKAQRYKALRKVRPFINRMVGLTGTPVPKGLMDLFGEVGLIDSGKRLGRFIGRYRETYFRPGAMNPYTGVVYDYVPLPGAEEKIYDKISDITISMKSLDYLDMPERIFVDHFVDMSLDEWKLYDEMKKELCLEVKGETIDAANAAVLSGKLLQMADGGLYTADGNYVDIHSRKLDALEDLLEEANGQNVLIAYWYQMDHDRIMERLKSLGYKPRDLKTDKDIADWNDGNINVALISPASAGHGLNIQSGGHILIWYSLCWSLEMYEQTNARLWRQGQKYPVTIHHIICRGTVDEDVEFALQTKSTTQQHLITAVKVNLW